MALKVLVKIKFLYTHERIFLPRTDIQLIYALHRLITIQLEHHQMRSGLACS